MRKLTILCSIGGAFLGYGVGGGVASSLTSLYYRMADNYPKIESAPTQDEQISEIQDYADQVADETRKRDTTVTVISSLTAFVGGLFGYAHAKKQNASASHYTTIMEDNHEEHQSGCSIM